MRESHPAAKKAYAKKAPPKTPERAPTPAREELLLGIYAALRERDDARLAARELAAAIEVYVARQLASASSGMSRPGRQRVEAWLVQSEGPGRQRTAVEIGPGETKSFEFAVGLVPRSRSSDVVSLEVTMLADGRLIYPVVHVGPGPGVDADTHYDGDRSWTIRATSYDGSNTWRLSVESLGVVAY